MNATLDRFFDENHEREFLDLYGSGAIYGKIVETLKPDVWTPNPNARANITYFKKLGQLTELSFLSATVYREGKIFSSLQLALETSSRIILIKISEVNGVLLGERSETSI